MRRVRLETLPITGLWNVTSLMPGSIVRENNSRFYQTLIPPGLYIDYMIGGGSGVLVYDVCKLTTLARCLWT